MTRKIEEGSLIDGHMTFESPGVIPSYPFLFLLIELNFPVCKCWKHAQASEGIFTDIPIVYEYKRFQRAGFHDTKHKDLTLYEGKPNKHNNAAWEHLLEVGVVAISREENERLKNGTATTPANSNEYMVELELFHQLHCLKWIRDQLWELEEVVSSRKKLGEFSQRTDHNDHCIDYLRQSIMCHGDVTPITFEWNSEINNYLGHHSTEHQCRDFNQIFNWAKGRGRTGLMADGAHQNVELERPEMYD
ncbi:hypothetical protein F5B22DRAFT_653787 [Xylaria bambusicola]|uniref:uncharacterized protein n=1 Tax=Xylaria bambusicola TaxID=326684 RepID=UPI00200756B8|nr:uncharacterized protein F5B22DRAFT_653787 [Xylaria bambusicola]KAI0520849.1 hypothetical protein F5B22DRAFT_653787 [Xylaria bambusicola]